VGMILGDASMTMTCTRRRSGAAPSAWAATLGTSSDEALIERIADRDQLAMRTLFARYRVALYRWLLRLVSDTATAEDLLSEVFLDVWRHAAVFEGRSSVSTWLLAIARNKAISARRRRPDVELNEELTSTLADPADDPELMLEKKDRDEVLRRSVAQLSQGHAEIIDLVYYHGKSVNEVAEVMGLNAATVKTRMFYARKKLAELAAAA
jgi:RNA polymerase sigma-70 factor (ECF subfamily)